MRRERWDRTDSVIFKGVTLSLCERDRLHEALLYASARKEEEEREGVTRRGGESYILAAWKEIARRLS